MRVADVPTKVQTFQRSLQASHTHADTLWREAQQVHGELKLTTTYFFSSVFESPAVRVNLTLFDLFAFVTLFVCPKPKLC